MNGQLGAAASWPELTSAEWQAIDAIRAGSDIQTAARDTDVDLRTFRRLLASGAEKLRMTSALAAPSVEAERTNGRMHIPHMDPCPYCENFAGRYPEARGPFPYVAQDETTCVFLTGAPLGGMPGHCLVTTRRHVETIFDLTPEEQRALGVGVTRAARMLRAALDPEGVLVQQNNGAAAFQTVPHLHFHVIPKVAGPFPPVEPPTPLPAAATAALVERLREHW